MVNAEGTDVKRTIGFFLLIFVSLCLGSCVRTRPGVRKDDPYLYSRGPWNFNKGGLFDDIPQFTMQMFESMLDYGVQPVDPPSMYEPEETYSAGYLEEPQTSQGTAVSAPGASVNIPGTNTGVSISPAEVQSMGY